LVCQPLMIIAATDISLLQGLGLVKKCVLFIHLLLVGSVCVNVYSAVADLLLSSSNQESANLIGVQSCDS